MTISRGSLKLSLVDAFFFSLMVGAGESYLPAYALSVGMSGVLAGLFAAMPLIFGALIQLFTPAWVSRVGSVRRWVVGATFIQALSFMPLFYYSFSGEQPNFILLFVIAAFYWGSGFAAGPSWNYWMGHLVPGPVTTKFFASRLWVAQAGIMIGLIGGGYALHYKVAVGPFTSVFSLLFLISFICRASSSLILSRQELNPNWVYKSEHHGVRKSLKRFTQNKSYRDFFWFMFLFYIFIYISAPFVSPYLLSNLKYSYDQYMLVLASFILAKMLILQFVHKWIQKYGVKRIFLIGCIGVSPLPCFWFISTHWIWGIVLQFVSGMAWAMIEVGLSVIFFNQLKSDEKIPILTWYNFFYSTAVIIGSVWGGQILSFYGESFAGYTFTFVLGGILRTLWAIGYSMRTQGTDKLLFSDDLGGAPVLVQSRVIK